MNPEMRELANSFAQLAAIIMILITLAVSSAALSQWVSPEASDATSTSVQAPSLLASGAGQ
jgi:hypothetical protein